MTPSVGGDPSLDFHNTVSWSAGRPVGTERLHSYDDLLDWSAEHGLITPSEGDALREAARADADGAGRVFERAIDLRRVLDELFGATANGQTVPPDAVERFNEFLAGVPVLLRENDSGGFRWDWPRGSDLDRVLWPVVWAAASLLQSADAVLLGECANDRCGWLFVDRSRRHNRKWCDMKDCGNRAKVRRHYYRHKKRNPR